MSSSTKKILAVGGLILLSGLVVLGVFYGMIQIIRQTTAEALSPITDSNSALGTKVASILNPTPTILPDPITIIHEIRSLARLETLQYTMEKVITAEEGQGSLGFLFGDKILFVGHGTVIAGVDLARMRPEDLQVKEKVLYVRLPPAEIFVVDIDNEKSYVYNRDTGLLTKGDINLERLARVATEKEITKSALEEGILDQAQENAENYLSRLLRGLGYPEVVFMKSQATPQPAE
ncbi:MAG: DUF4230 domain-containing protein [Anaerolineaceae bacterium]|nr:DUF4230 domain-containing protein [Anaerolineaceae bacterium]